MKRLILLLALLCAVCGSLVADDTAKQPNILLVTADDLGCLLSCYGEKRIATP